MYRAVSWSPNTLPLRISCWWAETIFRWRISSMQLLRTALQEVGFQRSLDPEPAAIVPQPEKDGLHDVLANLLFVEDRPRKQHQVFVVFPEQGGKRLVAVVVHVAQQQPILVDIRHFLNLFRVCTSGRIACRPPRFEYNTTHFLRK